MTVNHLVPGSNPGAGATKFPIKSRFKSFINTKKKIKFFKLEDNKKDTKCISVF